MSTDTAEENTRQSERFKSSRKVMRSGRRSLKDKRVRNGRGSAVAIMVEETAKWKVVNLNSTRRIAK